VLLAVRQSGCALQEASSDLRADAEVVRAAVANDGLALRWASNALKQSAELVLRAVAQNGDALMCAGHALRADWRVVAAAVAQAGAGALAWASAELRGEDDDENDAKEDEVGGSIVLLVGGGRGSGGGGGNRGGSGTFVSVCQAGLLAARAWKDAFLPGTLPQDKPRASPLSLCDKALATVPPAVLAALERRCTAPPPGASGVAASGDAPRSPPRAKQRLMPCLLPKRLSSGPGSSFERSDRRSTTKPCPLATLGALDPDTSTALKKLVADFAGVPYGRSLRHLRKASAHLSEAGLL
jgi:hypothetical protein